MSNRKTIEERIENARAELAQKEAQVRRLLQQQKAQDRKERAHRLCSRGALVEKLLPGLAELTDEQFDVFVNKTLLTGYAERTLRQLLPAEPESGAGRNGGADAQQGGDAKPADAAPRTAAIPARETANAAHGAA
uniref:DUF3847 domain-containing protein n=1 Tax=uncultured bacterium contig00005 TaxID=1181497 RepID=A0A806KHP5_9BACT|nr:hypothetical protein [uncultured bacterium contig00005]